MARRRFEFVEGSSSKFWEVSADGASFTVTFGRIGTDGQSKTKKCKDAAAAKAEVGKLIVEKVQKGYSPASGKQQITTKKRATAATKQPTAQPKDPARSAANVETAIKSSVAIKSVCANATMLAPSSVFKSWDGNEPDAPKTFVGIAKSGAAAVAVFHDKESSYAIPRDGNVLLVQAIYGGEELEKQLTRIPTDKWKRLAGTYRSDGGEHVLFGGMYSASQYADPDMQLDIEAEAGLPCRITIPAGDYALEHYGEWSPVTNTEYMLARLMRLSAAEAAASAKLKVAAPKIPPPKKTAPRKRVAKKKPRK